MRLHILSDLHFDARRNSWREFADRIPCGLADVLVLAGDVMCMNDVAAPYMLAALRAKAPEVVYVLGNHEHYHGAFDVTKELAIDVCKSAGVRLLDASIEHIGGRRFVGGTLWFRRDEEALRHHHVMMDFELIEDFEPAVYQENERTLTFLSQTIEAQDIVVTHHLPAQESIARQYASPPHSALNPFFLCDCRDIILARQPALWIHGHTHIACDYQIGPTRVLCNPVGYPRESRTARLDLVVEV